MGANVIIKFYLDDLQRSKKYLYGKRKNIWK